MRVLAAQVARRVERAGRRGVGAGACQRVVASRQVHDVARITQAVQTRRVGQHRVRGIAAHEWCVVARPVWGGTAG